MTGTLVAKDLAGGHGHRTLFESLDLTVAPGDVVGVVGANGAGKTTLLRLLAGESTPMAGTVSTAPSDAFVGHLPAGARARCGGDRCRLPRAAYGCHRGDRGHGGSRGRTRVR